MRQVKHCFTSKVKHCLITPVSCDPDNQAMLNKSQGKSVWRGARLRRAMEEKNPQIRQSDLATACNVTKQVVHGWLKTGRIDKKYLPTICDLIGKPVEYLLEEGFQEPLMHRRPLRATEPGVFYGSDKLLMRINADWPLLSDVDRRRIHNEVVQKAQHVRDKIREHRESQPSERKTGLAEASNESVIHRVVDFIKRPRKPRS